jgi:hypothetical protein
MQTWEPDKCCGKHLKKAISAGALDSAASWDCPDCGCTWKPREMTAPLNGVSGESVTIRHWEPHPAIALFKV